MIIFAGAPLAGRGEFANALRWKLTSSHDELLSGALGPGRVSWRGRQFEAELGYRGPSMIPGSGKRGVSGCRKKSGSGIGKTEFGHFSAQAGFFSSSSHAAASEVARSFSG